jgi:hypothetical protein
MCVLSLSANFIWTVSHSKKKSMRYSHKCENVFVWSTRYFCQILMKLEFSRQSFENVSNIRFHFKYIYKLSVKRTFSFLLILYLLLYQYSNKYKVNRIEKVRLTDNLYIFELIKRQRTGMNRLKIRFHSNSSSGSRVVPCWQRRTNSHDVNSRFSQFCERAYKPY